MRKLFLAAAALLMFACNNAQTTYQTLKVNDFDSKRQEKNVQLLDVRTEEEYADKHIANSKNIDFNGPDFKTRISSLDKNKPVAVYCLSGGRSAKASAILKESGFKEVYNLDGGITAWIGAEKEVEGAKAAASGMTLDEYNTRIKNEKLVLVDFFAVWCGPCKKMKPKIEELAKKNEAKLIVETIDTDKNTQLAGDMDVNAIPLFILYKDGKEIWRNLGEFEIPVLQAIIDKN